MAKFRVLIDCSATLILNIEADSFEDAEEKANAAIYDEDVLFEEHKDDLCVWNPTIDEIVQEEE